MSCGLEIDGRYVKGAPFAKSLVTVAKTLEHEGYEVYGLLEALLGSIQWPDSEGPSSCGRWYVNRESKGKWLIEFRPPKPRRKRTKRKAP